MLTSGNYSNRHELKAAVTRFLALPKNDLTEHDCLGHELKAAVTRLLALPKNDLTEHDCLGHELKAAVM